MADTYDAATEWRNYIDVVFAREGHYMSSVGGQGVDNPSRQFLLGVVREYLKEHPEEQVALFDVGCATGVDYEVLRGAKLPSNWQYTGADLVTKLILRARSFFPKKENPNLQTFVQRDIRKLYRFEDKSFDIVWVRHVLGHLPGYSEAIAEVCRVCKGILLLIFPDKPAETESVYRSYVAEGAILYANVYSYKDIEDCLRENGFVNVVWEVAGDYICVAKRE